METHVSDFRKARAFAVIFARALAILVFFLIVKLYLLSWYVWNQGFDPLNTIPGYLTPLIVGMDIGVSCAIFLFYLGVHIIAGPVLKSFGKTVTAAVIFIVHFVTVSLVSLSAKINQIYGVPLDIEHFREAGIERFSEVWKVVFVLDSILAYLNPDVVILFIIGCALYWLVPRYLSSAVPRVFRLKQGLAVWGVTAMVMVLLPTITYSSLVGRYTYGLKTNVLINILRSYANNWVHRTPGAYDLEDFDAKEIIADLRQDLTGTSRTRVWDHVSLHAEEWLPATDLQHLQGAARDFNVVLIVLESTSVEHLDAQSSPNISRLVERGLSFGNYFTASTNSFESLYTIFYSDYIVSLGAPLSHVYQGPLPQPSLSRVFSEAKYDTGLFQTSWLAFLNTGFLWEDQRLDTIKGGEDFKKEGGRTWKF
ncbi:MAG: sulfatase-like hydrolase/transferase, partial [Deltaproteobacteria bacterium]|nr:sulfatase-like hydrolase/transferase [Deltaproteobacteria bacterium]